MTDPKAILPVLHLIRSGLASGLLTKEEVIGWADKIVTKDEQPDIFFIDLALSNSKSKNDILHYFSDYLKFEKPVIQGRPLLGLLYRQYMARQIDLDQTISTLFRLKLEATFTNREESYIHSLDNDYDCAVNNIYGTIQDVEIELVRFLTFYKNYSVDSFEKWQDLDLILESEIDKNIQRQIDEDQIESVTGFVRHKPWWKFW